MSVFSIHLFIALCAAICSDQINADKGDNPEVSINKENAIDLVTSTGLHLKFPYFSPEFKTMGEKLRQHVLTDIIGIMQYVNGTISDTIDKKGGLFKWLGATKDLISMVTAQNKRNKGEKVNIPIKDEYNRESSRMFKRLLFKSQQEEKDMKKRPQMDPIKLKGIVQRLMTAVVEGFRSNPVACYINWSGGKINDIPFEEYTSKLMAHLRQNGFGGLLSGIDKLLGAVTMFG